MTKRIETVTTKTVTCNISGDPAVSEDVRFAFEVELGDGSKAWEYRTMDLNEENTAIWNELVDDWLKVSDADPNSPGTDRRSPHRTARKNLARDKSTRKGSARTTATRKPSGSKDAAIRAWLKEHGHAVAARGSISKELRAVYDEAHKPA